VKPLKWYSAEDAEVCKSCATFHGVIVNINENFIVKVDQQINMNSRTANDGDVETPPLHDGCRCYVRPWDISIN
jgi:hypothetical protein